MKQIPVSVGLLVCEQVIVEEKTGNVTPVNCFVKRSVKQFPSEPFPFTVLAWLTNGLGDLRLEVVIQRLDTGEYIYRREAMFLFTGPLQELRCMFRIRDCSFPIPVPYQVMLLVDQELVAQRQITLAQKENLT